MGKRVVVMREVTERNEGIATGFVRLAGANRDRIIAYVTDALTGVWPAGCEGRDVYGDGRASEQILDAMLTRSNV